MAFDPNSSRTRYQSYGSLYRFDFESELDAMAPGVDPEDPEVVIVPSPDDDPIGEAARNVFGTEP